MLQHNDTTSYDRLQATLELAGMELRASEVHGMVCGELCRAARLGWDAGFSSLLGLPDAESGAGRAVLETADSLIEESRRALDGGMSFALLLPDGDDPIEERTEALADWARGFSVALLRGDDLTLKDLPDNSAEVVKDLIKISEAQPAEQSEENERALTEIEEYMRVGIQLVYEELHPDESDPSQQELH